MGQYEHRNNPIICFFNKLSKRKKEPMATLKKNQLFVLRQKCTNFMFPIFLLPLVNDLGQASTLEN